MDKLGALDEELFLFLNGLHAPWLDQPVFLISKTILWIPLYALLLYVIYKEYGNESWIILIGLALTITLSDQITTSLMKPFFARLRPSHNPELEGVIHFVNDYRGSRFGFASSHAANTFGTATFLYLLLHSRIRGIFVLFFWAALVSYTRIYLGVHYPGDLIAGAVVGALCSLVMFRLTLYLLKKWRSSRANRVSSGSTTS
jgi:undecaprenyl-diphosphatase